MASACHRQPSIALGAPDLPRPRQLLVDTGPPRQQPLACSRPTQGILLFASPALAVSRHALQDDPLPDCSARQVDRLMPLEEDVTNSSFSSSSSDFCMSSNSEDDEDLESTGSSSASSSISGFLSTAQIEASGQEGPLDCMASLSAALPIKRGLSRFFDGKSQSFSSLARVFSVADLAKPENPYAKRRRRAGMMNDSILKHHSFPPRCGPSAGIAKKQSATSKLKTLRQTLPREDMSLEGLAKCFSVPQF
ncbi:hypothetical protein KP509_10G070300 [Ceratopteris richardii]|uniref:Uncharacterized protein n=1 Tax=Ceratopteris richardii TaxID=49495 RepID=A0A8T2U617_CERRI|nr:hypothetical protein KP509_10G070300 [Ceratopteris richardii]